MDDLAGQVQSLESTKLRLEMQIEQMRKEHKREVQQREEENEDVRSSAQKKVKGIETEICQCNLSGIKNPKCGLYF